MFSLPKLTTGALRSASLRILFSCVLLLVALFYLLKTTSVFAAFVPYPPTYSDPKLESAESIPSFQEAIFTTPDYNKETFDYNTVAYTLNTVTTMITGCAFDDPKCKEFTGALPVIGTAIAGFYGVQPASGVVYLADIGEKLGIVKPAYAQGRGFNELTRGGIIHLWRGMRNVAYALFILLFVILAFAIMLRIRLSPQTVITIQSAIPRIIVSLILVTFSFAIAGFLLDLMFVATTLFNTVLRTVGGPGFFESALNVVLNFGTLFFASEVVMEAFLGTWGGLTAAIVFGPITLAIGVITIAVIAILFLFAAFRLLLTYAFAYAALLLQVILAPFIILFNTLPGRPLFWGWFGGLLAQVSVFVTAHVFITIGWFLMRSLQAFSGPEIPLPTYGFGDPEGILRLVRALLGLVILLMTPNVVNLVKESIRQSPRIGGIEGLELARVGTRELVVQRFIEPGVPTPSARGRVARTIYSLLGGRV